MVCSGTARTQRDRHLAAAKAGFSGIDALTGGVGHGNVAERWLQLLREPQCHFARCSCDRVADARFGMVEKCVRGCFTGRKQKQQGNYYDESRACA